MSELSTQEKCKLVVKLVEQAPPGEVNDVINDIRAIINDDEALMPLIQPSLRAYNLAQLAIIEHPEQDGVPAHSSLLSESNIAVGSDEERYVDSTAKRSFAFDHVTMAVRDIQPYELPEEEETFRSELTKSLGAYARNHFPGGIFSVSCSQYPLLPPAPPAAAPEPKETTKEQTREAPKVEEVGGSVPPAVRASAVAETSTLGTSEDIVTDVVPEQVGGGDAEPLATPAVGSEAINPAESLQKEEVDQPGGLEKLDEELKEEEIKEEASAPATNVSEPDMNERRRSIIEEIQMQEPNEDKLGVIETLAIEDDNMEGGSASAPAAEVAAAEEPAVESRKQERIDNPKYTLEIVGNRYNTSNFWTGRWRTRWTVDQANSTVEGLILVDVHYYEQGNVQLATKHSASFPCPKEAIGSQSVVSQIVTTISKIETSYHMELNDVYGDLSEKAFRSLRRALPITRQKMDWEKVSGYSLGSDISRARS